MGLETREKCVKSALQIIGVNLENVEYISTEQLCVCKFDAPIHVEAPSSPAKKKTIFEVKIKFRNCTEEFECLRCGESDSLIDMVCSSINAKFLKAISDIIDECYKLLDNGEDFTVTFARPAPYVRWVAAVVFIGSKSYRISSIDIKNTCLEAVEHHRRDRVKRCLKYFGCEEDLLEDKIYIRKHRDLDGGEYYRVVVGIYHSQGSTIEEASKEIAMLYWKTKILREFRKLGYRAEQPEIFNPQSRSRRERSISSKGFSRRKQDMDLETYRMEINLQERYKVEINKATYNKSEGLGIKAEVCIKETDKVLEGYGLTKQEALVNALEKYEPPKYKTVAYSLKIQQQILQRLQEIEGLGKHRSENLIVHLGASICANVFRITIMYSDTRIMMERYTIDLRDKTLEKDLDRMEDEVVKFLEQIENK